MGNSLQLSEAQNEGKTGGQTYCDTVPFTGARHIVTLSLLQGRWCTPCRRKSLHISGYYY